MATFQPKSAMLILRWVSASTGKFSGLISQRHSPTVMEPLKGKKDLQERPAVRIWSC